MTGSELSIGCKYLLPLAGLQALIEVLATRGYLVLGPALRDGAIIYDEITTLADLPAGWTDQQDAGRYQLARREQIKAVMRHAGPRMVLEHPVLSLRHWLDGFRKTPRG